MKVYSKADIIAQLEKMNAPKDSIVIMHSSLRAIGNVEGGAEGLLQILIEYFTENGGLFCVPTHTWHNLDKEITLDMASDDNCMGVFSTVALRSKLGIRSENPTHSLVVFGNRDKAKDFINDESFIKTATAPESCYGKLFNEKGYVLLVGVAQNKNTYLHAVDEILGTENRMAKEPLHMSVLRENGEIVKRDITLYHADFICDISLRFTKFDTAFRYHKCITDGFIGNAPTQLCNAEKLKETIELIYKNANGNDPLSDELPIPQKWYCY